MILRRLWDGRTPTRAPQTTLGKEKRHRTVVRVAPLQAAKDPVEQTP